MKESRTNRAVGRPTKYNQKYCNEILEFMARTSHEIVIDRTFYDDKNSEKIDSDWLKRWWVKKEEHKVFANIFPTLERFCHSIWIHKDTLVEWATAVDDKWVLIYPEFSDAYKRAKQIQEAILVENALANNYSPNFSMFVAKNAFGWKDKSEVDQKVEWDMKITVQI